MLKRGESIALVSWIFGIAAFLSVVAGCSSTETTGSGASQKGLAANPDVILREHAPIDPMQELGSYTVSRKISMFYRLDLKRDNFWTPSLAASFKRFEGRMRACYTERLAVQPSLKGAVSLSFRLEKGATAAKDLSRAGGSIKDLALVECLRKRVAEIPVNPPRNMRGLVTWEFNVIDGVAKN